MNDATITAEIDVRRLEQFARRIVPDDARLPVAGAHLLSKGLERLQASRPDLYEGLAQALSLAAEESDDLDRFRARHESAYQALALAVVGIYLTDQTVQEGLGYPGHRSVDVGDPYSRLAPYSELTAPVVARGFIWKSTPANPHNSTKE